MPAAAVQRQSAKRVVKLCGLIGRRRSLKCDMESRMDDNKKKSMEWLKGVDRIVIDPVKVDFGRQWKGSDLGDAFAYANLGRID